MTKCPNCGFKLPFTSHEDVCSKAGKASSSKLTKAERSAKGKMMANKRWNKSV